MKDMENGKVVLDYDTTEGINIDDENFIDDRNDSDVGNIVIGINPTQIGAAMLVWRLFRRWGFRLSATRMQRKRLLY